MSIKSDLEAIYGRLLAARGILEHEHDTRPPETVVAMLDVKFAIRHITIAMSVIQNKIDVIERKELKSSCN